MARIKHTVENSKKAIISAEAARLFRQKGYHSTSMRDLADRVGVEAASLYNHIKNKAELLQDICFKVADAFNTHVDEVEQSRQTELEKVEDIIRFHINIMFDNYEEVYVSNHDWHHLKEPSHTDFLNQRRRYEKRLAAIIEQGVIKKEIKNIHPYVAVLTLLSAVRGIEYWHRHKRNVTPAELEEDMVVHLISGIKA